MTLEALLETINENMTVILMESETQTRVSLYDGKNSIDEIFNECEVMDIVATAEDELTIDIDTSDVDPLKITHYIHDDYRGYSTRYESDYYEDWELNPYAIN